MTVADLAEHRKVFGWRVDQPPGVADRLDHDRGDRLGVFHLDGVVDQRGTSDVARRISLAERAAVTRRRENMQEPWREGFVDGLPPFQSRRRERSERRAVPRHITADDLIFAGMAGELVILPRQLDRRLGDFRPATLKLHNREIPWREFGEHVREPDGHGVGAVHRRREAEDVHLLAGRFDHAAIAVAERGDVNARKRVEIMLAGDVPIMNALGPGHHERMLRPFRHLVAHEDLAEEAFLG